MGDFVVQECCVHGTDLESHGPTSILCDDPLPLLTIKYVSSSEYNKTRLEFRNHMHFARLYSFFKNFASLRENIKQYYYFRDLTIQ